MRLYTLWQSRDPYLQLFASSAQAALSGALTLEEKAWTSRIERLRAELEASTEKVTRTDFGAGLRHAAEAASAGAQAPLDGVKTIDPRNAMIKQGVSGLDNMFLVPGDEAKFQDQQAVPHGDVRKVWYDSKTLGAQRRMHVYTPPGYSTSGQRYPVLYLHDGQNLFEGATAFVPGQDWHVSDTAEEFYSDVGDFASDTWDGATDIAHDSM